MMCASLLLTGCTHDHHQHKEVKVSLAREFNLSQLDAQAFDVPMPVYSAIYQPLVTYGEMERLSLVWLNLGKSLITEKIIRFT